ncbi:MAG: cytochrome b/b6 domain-containing protein [Desulfobacterales bacterium]
MAPNGSMPAAVKTVAALHSFFANFIWLYFIGHVAMALFHQFRGEPLITDMLT